MGRGAGPLDAQYFHIGSKATDSNHYFILDLSRSRLLLDVNGNEKGGATVLAEFRNGALPDVGDIVVA